MTTKKPSKTSSIWTKADSIKLQEKTLTTMDLSPSSLASARHQLKLFWGYLDRENIQFPALNPEILKNYLQDLKNRGYSSSSLRSSHWALKRFLFACPDFDPIDNPKGRQQLIALFHQNNPPKAANRIEKPHYLTHAEVQELLRYCNRHRGSPRDRRIGAIIQLFYVTGCRASELLEAQLKSVTQLNEIIHIKVNGKGNKERVVYCKVSVWDEIMSVLQPKTWIIETTKATQMDQANLYRQISRVCQKAIGRKVHPHMLRHSTSMALLSSKSPVDPKAISLYLGHQDVSTFMRYYNHSKPDPEAIVGNLQG